MNHFASSGFWEFLAQLPDDVQQLARANYELLKHDPHHPSLHLKRVGRYWSVRIGRKHRALGEDTDGGILWAWIGTHAEYDQILRRR